MSFAAISDQLSKLIRHDYALLTLCNQTDRLDVYAGCIAHGRRWWRR